MQHLADNRSTEVLHVFSERLEGWQGLIGMIDPALLRARFAPRARRDLFFIQCGPSAMLKAVEKALKAIGIPASHFLSQRFVHERSVLFGQKETGQGVCCRSSLRSVLSRPGASFGYCGISQRKNW